MKQAFDETLFSECSELMGEELPTVLHAYIGLLEQGMDKMKTAYVSGDMQTIYQTAHSLKSSSRQLGLLGFSDMMKQLEQLSKSESKERVQPLLNEAEAKAAEVLQAVQSKL